MNRLNNINKIRKKLDNGGFSLGTWMQIPHPSIAEILGQSGYDWVAIDFEHGSISIHQLPDLCRAIELGDTLPIVRVAEGSSKDCKQALDAGAGGIIVPMVQSAEQLKVVRDACCYPPVGKRGVGYSRANLFGKNFVEYTEEAKQPLLVAMIEHISALKELDSIAKVDGLDAVLIGMWDLSASMGKIADFKNPEFLAAMDQIRKILEKSKIPFGVHLAEPIANELQLKLNEGFRFLAYSVDSVFLRSISDAPNIEIEK